LHNPKYKFVFHIVKFGMNNFRFFENMRLQEEIMKVQKEIYKFLKYVCVD